MSKSLAKWLEKVLDLCEGRCGIDMLEASAYDWNKLYHAGYTPEEAVNLYEEDTN